MVKSTRREYLETIRKRYRRACKKDKKPILDEFCVNCGYHRKYAIRLLGHRASLHIKKPGAKPIYDSTELLIVLKRIWFVSTCLNPITSVQKQKTALMNTFLNTHPFVLKKTIQAKLKIIFNALK